MQAEDGHRVRPVEYLVGGYLVITSVVALIRLENQAACAWVLLANALYLLLIVLFVRAELGAIGKGLREIFPLVLLTSTYGALDLLNNFGAIPTHDQWAMHADQVLFGGQISREWWQAHPSPFLSYVFHASYFAYYPCCTSFSRVGSKPAAARSCGSRGPSSAAISCSLPFR